MYERYYCGDYEEQLINGVRQKIHHLDVGIIAVHEDDNPVEYFFTYGDYLGSVLAVTERSGNLLERQSFDSWGQHRNASDWTDQNVGSGSLSWLYRGYTGQIRNQGKFWSGKVDEVGSAAPRQGDHFLTETIAPGTSPTDNAKVASTYSNKDYGKYGMTRNNGTKMHKGVDYSGKVGDNVYAMYEGKVTYSGYSKSYGSNFVRIRSKINGRYYNVDYGHMSVSYVSSGDHVKMGHLIGLMGRLGNLANTTFPTHVHVSIWRGNNGARGFVEPQISLMNYFYK